IQHNQPLVVSVIGKNITQFPIFIPRKTFRGTDGHYFGLGILHAGSIGINMLKPIEYPKTTLFVTGKKQVIRFQFFTGCIFGSFRNLSCRQIFPFTIFVV
ncbi:MAG TPA: hypothetical protein PL048_26435, partial [Leptospiraceae bacterium]|nr:hypothetical protein [Leptospiraceae bacterium]